MTGQSHHNDRRGSATGAEARRATPAHVDHPGLFRELCKHLEGWFPERFSRATIEEIVASVLTAWHDSPTSALKELTTPHRVRSMLVTAVNRAAVDRLASEPDFLLSTGVVDMSHDNTVTRELFGRAFDADAVIRAMRTLIVRGQVREFCIVTQYLDMAYLTGHVPTACKVAERLDTSENRVRSTLALFRHMLVEQRVHGS